MANQEKIQEIIKSLLIELGEDTTREGLLDTPKRVAAAYDRTLGGYGRSLGAEMTVFENSHNYDDVVFSGNIDFFSTCEHHLMPFYGKAHVAYIPGKKIIGLSKLARAIDIYSRRLQDQERITIQVANALHDLLKPQGVAVMLEGTHFCNISRGVEQVNSNMKTIHFVGSFKDNSVLQDRFMRMVD